mmetsp:Transcript_20318/g.60723  ORF Transcript_20318/g.60723 Transcript_20318/m.60723 type:complete len:82 (+) Transcript_20318:618-863(+)
MNALTHRGGADAPDSEGLRWLNDIDAARKCLERGMTSTGAGGTARRRSARHAGRATSTWRGYYWSTVPTFTEGIIATPRCY